MNSHPLSTQFDLPANMRSKNITNFQIEMLFKSKSINFHTFKKFDMLKVN